VFKNVLIGIDAKQNGRDAVALATRLLHEDGKLTFAHVQRAELHGFDPLGPALRAAQREEMEKLLHSERVAAGVAADVVALFAPTPGRGLHERAEEQGADLIVVGSCSRGLLGRVMLGDDTRDALNGTPCTVAVAARGYARNPVAIDRIGVGYDGSPESMAALATAKDLARETGGEVTALQVVSIPPVMWTGLMPPLVGESVDIMLEEATGRLRQMPDITGRAVYGVPGEELAAFGDELDLLVVGSRNFGPVRRRIVGSTCDYLERHARCSLLTIPRVGDASARAESAAVPAATAV
jgi:nucleotide-binding universal stress UspA family protein